MLGATVSLTSATCSLKISLFRELLETKCLSEEKDPIVPPLLSRLYLKKKLDVKKTYIKIVFQTHNVVFFLNAKPNV